MTKKTPKRTMTAAAVKKLVVQKQHFHALNHSVQVEDVLDEKLRKALEKYLSACKNVDRVLKAAIAREATKN